MQDTDSEVERVEHRRKIYSIAALGVLAVVVIAGVSTFFVIRNQYRQLPVDRPHSKLSV